jgi:hypothetical protein
MIINKIVEAILGLAQWIVDLLPTSPAPSAVDFGAFATSHNALFVNRWFPVSTIAAAVVVAFAWSLAISGIKFMVWVLALIHVGGTD